MHADANTPFLAVLLRRGGARQQLAILGFPLNIDVDQGQLAGQFGTGQYVEVELRHLACVCPVTFCNPVPEAVVDDLNRALDFGASSQPMQCKQTPDDQCERWRVGIDLSSDFLELPGVEEDVRQRGSNLRRLAACQRLSKPLDGIVGPSADGGEVPGDAQHPRMNAVVHGRRMYEFQELLHLRERRLRFVAGMRNARAAGHHDQQWQL